MFICLKFILNSYFHSFISYVWKWTFGSFRIQLVRARRALWLIQYLKRVRFQMKMKNTSRGLFCITNNKNQSFVLLQIIACSNSHQWNSASMKLKCNSYLYYYDNWVSFKCFNHSSTHVRLHRLRISGLFGYLETHKIALLFLYKRNFPHRNVKFSV